MALFASLAIALTVYFMLDWSTASNKNSEQSSATLDSEARKDYESLALLLSTRIQLYGIFSNGTNTMAIISIDNGKQEEFKPGQFIEPSIKLIDVRNDSVIIDSNGQRFELFITSQNNQNKTTTDKSLPADEPLPAGRDPRLATGITMQP